MSHNFKRGDRIDWHDYNDGEIVVVGLGTLRTEFQTPHGLLRLPVPIHEARRHVARHAITIGGFQLRVYAPGKIKIDWKLTGEMAVFDESALESILEKFWKKHF